MNWYYSIEGSQQGPVGGDELAALHQATTITNAALVWREGMSEWESYSSIFPSTPPSELVSSKPPNALRITTANQPVCSQCGGSFSNDEIISIDGKPICGACKPQYLQRVREGVGGGHFESVRQEHIKHEASIKSVGVLYLIGGACTLLLAGIYATAAMAAGNAEIGIAFAVLFLVFAAVQIAIGLGVRRLKSWSRIVCIIFSVIGLLGFPVGTLINGYILYLLISEKGRTVFSDEYQHIIRQTPHIIYRTSLVVWIVLGVLVLFIFIAIGAAMLGTPR